MLTVTLLGCGGTMPLPHRALSSAAVTVNGRHILLDCGEGTQTACRRHHISLYKTDAICLTHYHGDHIFGLPGFLQSMASAGRTAPVTIAGPPGLRRVVDAMILLCGELPFALQLQELPAEGGALELAAPALAGLRLTAFAARHRIPCLGYRLELPRAGRFDPQKAAALGVPQRDWKRLQQGATVPLGNGQSVTPEQVLGPIRPGLTVVFCTDTRPCDALEQAAQNADLLICDATYAEDSQQDKAVEFGHCTFGEAAALAARAGAKRLWLSHYSAAIADPEEFLPAAQIHFAASEAGFDGKRLELTFEHST